MAWAMVIAAGLLEMVCGPTAPSVPMDSRVSDGREGPWPPRSSVSACWCFRCVACRLAKLTPFGRASGQHESSCKHCHIGRVRQCMARAALIVLGVCAYAFHQHQMILGSVLLSARRLLRWPARWFRRVCRDAPLPAQLHQWSAPYPHWAVRGPHRRQTQPRL